MNKRQEGISENTKFKENGEDLYLAGMLHFYAEKEVCLCAP